jgi:DNA damage-binding protein 1
LGLVQIVGEYHLGEFVNRFRHGSLVMRLPDSEAAQIPTLIYGTINGVIGVVASLPQELFLVVQRLQTALNKVRSSTGRASPGRIRGWFEGQGVSTSRVSPPGPLSIS